MKHCNPKFPTRGCCYIRFYDLGRNRVKTVRSGWINTMVRTSSIHGGPNNLQVLMEVRTNSDGGPDKFDKKAGWRAHLYVESSP